MSGSSFKINEETDPEVALKLYMSGVRNSETMSDNKQRKSSGVTS